MDLAPDFHMVIRVDEATQMAAGDPINITALPRHIIEDIVGKMSLYDLLSLSDSPSELHASALFHLSQTKISHMEIASVPQDDVVRVTVTLENGYWCHFDFAALTGRVLPKHFGDSLVFALNLASLCSTDNADFLFHSEFLPLGLQEFRLAGLKVNEPVVFRSITWAVHAPIEGYLDVMAPDITYIDNDLGLAPEDSMLQALHNLEDDGRL